jgi:hypothetical protein
MSGVTNQPSFTSTHVLGLLYHAHPTATELLDNAVVRNVGPLIGATPCYAGH